MSKKFFQKLVNWDSKNDNKLCSKIQARMPYGTDMEDTASRLTQARTGHFPETWTSNFDRIRADRD